MTAWAEFTRLTRKGFVPVMVWLLDEKTQIIHKEEPAIVHRRLYVITNDDDNRPVRIPFGMEILTEDDRVRTLHPQCIVFTSLTDEDPVLRV